MKLAHFSDLHLCQEFGIKSQLGVLREMVKDAILRDAEHFVFTGDFVDYGNLTDFGKFCAMLAGMGIKSSRVTVLPGNHDIYPIRGAGHGCSLATIMQMTVDMATRQNAQKNLERFSRLARRFTDPMEQLGPDGGFCYIRMLSRSAVLVAMDSTHSHWSGRLDTAVGHLDLDKMDSISEALSRAPYNQASRRILAMHHRPWLNSALMRTNFDNLKQVQSFIRRSNFDVVLCGHVHEFTEKQIAGASAFCSACHFDVNEDEEDIGYTLVSLGRSIKGRVFRFTR